MASDKEQAQQRLAQARKRLEEMQQLDQELQAELGSRADRRAGLIERHQAKLATFDAETETLTTRRADNKQDFDNLHETVGLLEKAVGAMGPAESPE